MYTTVHIYCTTIMFSCACLEFSHSDQKVKSYPALPHVGSWNWKLDQKVLFRNVLTFSDNLLNDANLLEVDHKMLLIVHI